MVWFFLSSFSKMDNFVVTMYIHLMFFLYIVGKMYNLHWNIVESGVKHHQTTNKQQSNTIYSSDI